MSIPVKLELHITKQLSCYCFVSIYSSLQSHIILMRGFSENRWSLTLLPSELYRYAVLLLSFYCLNRAGFIQELVKLLLKHGDFIHSWKIVDVDHIVEDLGPRSLGLSGDTKAVG